MMNPYNVVLFKTTGPHLAAKITLRNLSQTLMKSVLFSVLCVWKTSCFYLLFTEMSATVRFFTPSLIVLAS